MDFIVPMGLIYRGFVFVHKDNMIIEAENKKIGISIETEEPVKVKDIKRTKNYIKGIIDTLFKEGTISH